MRISSSGILGAISGSRKKCDPEIQWSQNARAPEDAEERQKMVDAIREVGKKIKDRGPYTVAYVLFFSSLHLLMMHSSTVHTGGRRDSKLPDNDPHLTIRGNYHTFHVKYNEDVSEFTC